MLLKRCGLYLGIWLLLWGIGGISFQACHGDECQLDKDCISANGPNYICRIDAGKIKRCLVKKTEEKKCSPECPAGQLCKEGKCEVVQPKACEPACKKGYTCKDTKCVLTDPNICEPACHEAYICKNNKCVLKQGSEACVPACQSDEVCSERKCILKTCKPACSEGSECQAGKCVKVETCLPKTCKKCVKGFCRDIDPMHYQRCEKDKSKCPSWYGCLFMQSPKQKVGYCVHRCSSKMQSCGENEICVFSDRGNGFCIPKGKLIEGDKCDYNNPTPKLDNGQLCAPDHSCFTISRKAARCFKLKEGGDCRIDSSHCGPGQMCRTFSSSTKTWAICFTKCQNNKCPLSAPELFCRNADGNTFCYPKDR